MLVKYLIIGIRVVFGFRGTPLLLRVYLSSWVYDKLGFSGRFAGVILLLKESRAVLELRSRNSMDIILSYGSSSWRISW